MLPLKSPRHEQFAVMLVLLAERLNVRHIHSKMHPAYGDKCFTKPTGYSTRLM